jgi:hypothetical protein
LTGQGSRRAGAGFIFKVHGLLRLATGVRASDGG